MWSHRDNNRVWLSHMSFSFVLIMKVLNLVLVNLCLWKLLHSLRDVSQKRSRKIIAEQGILEQLQRYWFKECMQNVPMPYNISSLGQQTISADAFCTKASYCTARLQDIERDCTNHWPVSKYLYNFYWILLTCIFYSPNPTRSARFKVFSLHVKVMKPNFSSGLLHDTCIALYHVPDDI